MDCFVIFMGGTGGRCMEALGYVLSAGLLAHPTGKPGDIRAHHTMHVLSMDTDKAHKNVAKGREVLRRYKRIRDQLRTPDVEKYENSTLFDVDIQLTEWLVQPSGFELDTGEVFRVVNLAGKDADAQNVGDLLFSDEEQKVEPQEYGFRAHPNVGAAVMHATMLRLTRENREDRPYLEFRQRIATAARQAGGEEVRVLLVGSLFGGTGAASFPTIAGDIRRHVTAQNLRIGAVMLGKYFEFDGLPTAASTDGAIRPESENFEVATMEALRYYSEGSHRHFSTIYLLGAPIAQKVKRRADGGKDQENPPMYVELETALACVDFFGAPAPSGPRGRFPHVLYRYVDVEGGALICSWKSLSGGLEVAAVLARMLYFSAVYANHYAPEVEAYHKQNGRGAPVYFRAHLGPYMEAFGNQEGYLMTLMLEYCVGFLDWFRQIALIPQEAENGRTVAQQYIQMEQLYQRLCRLEDKAGEDLWPLYARRGGDGRLFNDAVTLYPLYVAGIDKKLHSFSPAMTDKPEHKTARFYHFLYANCVKDRAARDGKKRRVPNG